jgi:predicted GIY-YIG superfamily endonuclease
MEDIVMSFKNNIKMIMEDEHLPVTAKAIYSYILSLTDENGKAILSSAKIYEKLDIGCDTYYKYLKLLAERGYIKNEQLRENGYFGNTLYAIIDNPILTDLEKRGKKGFLYVIKDNDNNFKIGIAKNFKRRLKNYTEMAYNPEVIHVMECKDNRQVEKYFSTVFESKRLKGEWFKLNKKDVEYIKSGEYPDHIKSLIV